MISEQAHLLTFYPSFLRVVYSSKSKAIFVIPKIFHMMCQKQTLLVGLEIN